MAIQCTVFNSARAKRIHRMHWAYAFTVVASIGRTYSFSVDVKEGRQYWLARRSRSLSHTKYWPHIRSTGTSRGELPYRRSYSNHFCRLCGAIEDGDIGSSYVITFPCIHSMSIVVRLFGANCVFDSTIIRSTQHYNGHFN